MSYSKKTKDNKPNIIFIFTDQQTLGAMSACGNPWVNTPNMDSIASDGVLFQNSYCSLIGILLTSVLSYPLYSGNRVG